MPEAIRTTREQALAVWCPLCGAGVGEECADERGQGTKVIRRPRARGSLHSARHEHAVALGASRRQRPELEP